MRRYIALIHKEPKSDFGVSFPDFPGCVTAGGTLQDAVDMAAEALALHIDGMADDGAVIPEPSTIETVMAEPENRDGVAVLVAAPEDRAKTVRVNITLSEDALRAIDAHAEREGFTRSGFIVHAAKAAMRGRVARTASPQAEPKRPGGFAEAAAPAPTGKIKRSRGSRR